MLVLGYVLGLFCFGFRIMQLCFCLFCFAPLIVTVYFSLLVALVGLLLIDCWVCLIWLLAHHVNICRRFVVLGGRRSGAS